MKWKKVIAAILAVTLVFGVLPGTVFAEDADGSTAENAITVENDEWETITLNDGKYYKIPSQTTITSPIVLSGDSHLTVEGTVDVSQNDYADIFYETDPAITVTSGTLSVKNGATVKAYGSNPAITKGEGGTVTLENGSKFGTDPSAFLTAEQQTKKSGDLWEVEKKPDTDVKQKEFDDLKGSYKQKIRDWMADKNYSSLRSQLVTQLQALEQVTFTASQHAEDLEQEFSTKKGELDKAYQAAEKLVMDKINAVETKVAEALTELQALCTEYGVHYDTESADESSVVAVAKTAIEAKISAYQGEDGYPKYEWVSQLQDIIRLVTPHIQEIGKLNKDKEKAKQALTDLVNGISVENALTTAKAAIDAVKYTLQGDFQTQQQVDQTWSERLEKAQANAGKDLAQAAINVIAEANKGKLDEAGVSAVTKEYTEKLNGDEVAWTVIEKLVPDVKNELPLKLAKADAVAQLTTAAKEAIDAGANKTQAERYRDDGIANINIAPNKDIVTMYLNVALNNINGLKKDLESLKQYQSDKSDALDNILSDYLQSKGHGDDASLNTEVKQKLDAAVETIIEDAKSSIGTAKSTDGVDSYYNQAEKNIKAAADLAIEKDEKITALQQYLDGKGDSKPQDFNLTPYNTAIASATSTYEANSELQKGKDAIDAEIAKAQLKVEMQTAKGQITTQAQNLYKSYGLNYQDYEGAKSIVKKYNGEDGVQGSIDKASSGPFDVFVSSATSELQIQLTKDAKTAYVKKLKDYVTQLIANKDGTFTFTLIIWDDEARKYRPMKDSEYDECLADYISTINNVSLTPGNEEAGKTAIDAALQQAETALADSSYKGYVLTIKAQDQADDVTYHVPNTKVNVELKGDQADKVKYWTENEKVYSPFSRFSIWMDHSHTFTAQFEESSSSNNELELTFKSATDPVTGNYFITVNQQYVITKSDATVEEVGFLYASGNRVDPQGHQLQNWMESTFDYGSYDAQKVSKATSKSTAKFGSFDLKLNMQSSNTVNVYGYAYVKLSDGSFVQKYFVVSYNTLQSKGNVVTEDENGLYDSTKQD